MITTFLRGPATEVVPCTIEIENTFDSLSAHVELHDTKPAEAGDEVLVHGSAIRVPYGQKITLKRNATVTRAGAMKRALTKLAARFELTDLYEVSFSSGRNL
jgi:hypothetical protein